MMKLLHSMLLVLLVEYSAAVPSNFQIIQGLCRLPKPAITPSVQAIANNDEYPRVPTFPPLCALRPSIRSLDQQICCECMAVAHPKFCKNEFWPKGAVNVTNFQQVYDIRRQKQTFSISGQSYTLMFQFCCSRSWLDSRSSDEEQLWTTDRLDIWKLINDPNYEFKPVDSSKNGGLSDATKAPKNLVVNCTDYDPKACPLGKEVGACSNEEFANLCKPTCGLCVPDSDGPTPPRAGPSQSDRVRTGKCSRDQIPSNVCGKSTAGTNKLRWYFHEGHHDCLAFTDRGCVEDDTLGNRYDSYSSCMAQCAPSDSPPCAANKAAVTDPVTKEAMLCEYDRSSGTDSCPAGSTCMRGAFFSVCCDKKNEDDYERSYRAECSNGSAHVTFRDGELVRPLLGASCDRQHGNFCPDDSRCVRSAKLAHCCRM